MSSRQLRKLQKQRELEQAKIKIEKVTPEEEEEEEEFPLTTKPSGFASFALLQQEDNAEDDEDVDELVGPEEDVVQEAPKPTSAKKSRKKKKKAKAKDKVAAAEATAHSGPDEIDAALEALNTKPKDTSGAPEDAAGPAWRRHAEYDRICALLGISSQQLKVANEMRSLFGSSATSNHDDAGGAVPRAGRRVQRNQPMDLETALKNHDPTGKGLPEVTMRRNPFIQGKSEWPKGTTGGLTMAIVDNMENTDGTIEFRFVHSEAYERVQQQFYMFVEMGDPSNLIGLLQQNPYNISLLLQVSKIAKDQGDHALSSDLIERTLFTFGRAAISSFTAKLQIGKARLDFARPENRELWLAGYHYIKSLMMKGTYRTALEWAKLLFALSPEEDHYSMNLVMHHLAVRAYESKWLMSIYDTSIFAMVSEYSSPSVALAALQLKDMAKSKEILSKDVKRLPWLFCMLFQELNLDPPPSIWGSVPGCDGERLFSELYIRQTKDIWNTPNATSLLKEAAAAAPKLGASRAQSSYRPPRVTLDVARYVYLEQARELMSLVPSDLLHRQPNSDFDPLPPSRENNIFSHPSQRLQFQVSPTQRAINPANMMQAHMLQAMADVLPEWLLQNRRPHRAEDDEDTEDSEDDDEDDDDVESVFEDELDDDEDDDRLRATEQDHRLFELLTSRMPGMFPDTDSSEEDAIEEGPMRGYMFQLMQQFNGFVNASRDVPGDVDEDSTDDDDDPAGDELPDLDPT